MDEFLRSLLLVLCGLVAVIALVIAYLWYFIFGKSLRGVLMAGLSIMLNRDSKLDLDDDPQLVKRPQDVKSEMQHEVGSLDFESRISDSDEYIPQTHVEDSDGFSAQRVEPAKLTEELVSSSFEDGRFRRIAKAFSRPFLRMRLNTTSDLPAENVRRGTDTKNVE